MTLTKFMARSTWVACASELGKLLKCHLKEKANRKLANGQNIEDSESRKWPKGLSAPALELNTIIFKHVYWYMQLISGERLQDHWSSGCLCQNKGADQLRSNCEADQRLCFHYSHSTTPLLP